MKSEQVVLCCNQTLQSQAFSDEEGVSKSRVVNAGNVVRNFILLSTNSSELRCEASSADNIHVLTKEFLQLWVTRFLFIQGLHDSDIVAEHVDDLPTPPLSPEPGRHKCNPELLYMDSNAWILEPSWKWARPVLRPKIGSSPRGLGVSAVYQS